jgi:tRNA threonylcarbamoyl adenosine modification protein YeaZ
MGTTLLAIDTAGSRLQLALLRADGEVVTLVEEMAQGQAERIFPAIDELLTRRAVAYRDLNRVAVTTGPGSFTGLRIGLSAARGLGLALQIPVVGIGSLQAISLSGRPHTPVVVLLDARRNEAYFQHFFAPGEPIDGPVLLGVEAAYRRIPTGMTPLAGPSPDIAALARYAAELEPRHFLPEPAYVRGADAKPQERFRVERAVAS